MDEFKDELNKLGMWKKPLEVAAASVALCFASRKILGVKLGVNCETFEGAAKAFGFMTLVGVGVEWANMKKKEKAGPIDVK